ncbi:MAG TPA: hypothetical protein VLG47_06880 [Candidatus Saccharimonadales bacterium]|nr:hypothetical protein [Candidatus Saccharimonadales bacterium]
MPRTRLIPGFDTAPGPNRAMVQDLSRTYIIYPPHCPIPDESTIDRARKNLGIKQRAAEQLGPVSLMDPAAIGEYQKARSGWNALTSNVQDMLRKSITDEYIPKSWPGFKDFDEIRESYLGAACDGAATDIAYLEVLSKVLFRHEFRDPNTRIAQWARKSVGFIIEWAGLHKQGDIDLAYGLSYRKQRGTKGVFEDMQFNPKWFVAHDNIERVGVNPELVPNIKRAIHLHRLSQKYVNPHLVYLSPDPLFACPGMKIIPQIHELAVVTAESAGLFERTWLEERANNGYPEAWFALDALRAAANV